MNPCSVKDGDTMYGITFLLKSTLCRPLGSVSASRIGILSGAGGISLFGVSMGFQGGFERSVTPFEALLRRVDGSFWWFEILFGLIFIRCFFFCVLDEKSHVHR